VSARLQIFVARTQRVSDTSGDIVAEAAAWLNAGDEEDVERAKAWAAREGWQVFVYPATQADPLRKAKADVIAAHWAALPTLTAYRADRARRLAADYPDSTPEERAAIVTAQADREWMTLLSGLPRTAVVPLRVGRSLVAHVGHVEAGRTLRHVANFPDCLPTRAADGAKRGR
jgi:hypothetical protein